MTDMAIFPQSVFLGQRDFAPLDYSAGNAFMFLLIVTQPVFNRSRLVPQWLCTSRTLAVFSSSSCAALVAYNLILWEIGFVVLFKGIRRRH